MGKPYRALCALAISCLPLLVLAQPAVTPQPLSVAGAVTHIYKVAGRTELRLHVFNPPNQPVAGKRPAIVFFFGGGWTNGNIEQFAPQSRHLAARGMVAIVADYRVAGRHQTSPFEAMADARSAIRWVRSRAQELGVDPDRIAAGGGSAGGHIALSAAVISGVDDGGEDPRVSAKPNALVLFNPVVDTTARADNRFGDRATAASPMHHLARGLPPAFIVHGKADTTVPYTEVERFCRESRALGNRCELIGYEGAPHGFFNPQVQGGKWHQETLLEADRFLTSLGYLPALAPARQPEGPPNVLLIQADDLGYGDLSAYGQARFQTPVLDRLASEGIRFTHYYAGSTVCAPSRAALMTGMHTGHASIRGNGGMPGGDVALRPEDVTVAEVLRDAGYRTAVIGKWGSGQPGSTGQPDRQGFDYAFGFLDQRHAHRQFTDHLWRNGERVAVDLERDYVNELFTKEAGAFIERADRRPFFVYLNYTVPHAELRVPAEAVAPFRGVFPEKPFANAAADSQPGGATPESRSLGYRSQPEPRAAFAGMITRMDRDIGMLVDLLRARGLDRQALIMFTSDNGPHQEGGADPAFFKSSGGLRGIKRDLYEGGIRVPMIARWTGTIPAGRVSDHPWTHWDVLPTVADVAGAKAPSGLDGISMGRALRGEPQPGHRFLYWEFHERGFQQAVRMGRWKAVRLKPGAPLEVYDLVADPGEQSDVAGANPAIVATIEEYLRTARTPSERWPGP